MKLVFIITFTMAHTAHHDFSPDGSPDRARIVTAISGNESERTLIVYDTRGRQQHRFAGSFHRVFQPTRSPDGRWIAFAARATDGAGADIYLAPATGGAGSPSSR